jgi:hypothetical protein
MVQPTLDRFERYWVNHILDTAKSISNHREGHELVDSDIDKALELFSKYIGVCIYFIFSDQRFTESIPFRADQQKILANEINSKPLPQIDTSSLLHTPKDYMRFIFPDYVRRETEDLVSGGNIQSKSF